MAYYNFQKQKGEMCVKIPFKFKKCGVSCHSLHIIFDRLKETSLFGTEPCKNYTVIILISFSILLINMLLRLVTLNVNVNVLLYKIVIDH